MSIEVKKRQNELRRSAWLSNTMARMIEMQVGESTEVKPYDINSYSNLKARLSRNTTGFTFKVEQLGKLLKITRTI
jgi:hypothetical protein